MLVSERCIISFSSTPQKECFYSKDKIATRTKASAGFWSQFFRGSGFRMLGQREASFLPRAGQRRAEPQQEAVASKPWSEAKRQGGLRRHEKESGLGFSLAESQKVSTHSTKQTFVRLPAKKPTPSSEKYLQRSINS